MIAVVLTRRYPVAVSESLSLKSCSGPLAPLVGLRAVVGIYHLSAAFSTVGEAASKPAAP